MPGKIKVKILAGRNLPVMDRSGDTTDAYVELKFGNITYKTDVCRKSLNPQWNSEWYRFEVDDAELQDEPLQIRLMDHDTYSANDAIGKVYINLNPLLLPGMLPPVKNIWTLEAAMNTTAGSQGSVMTGWIPVYDTMHGIRGEVNIIIKVELFSDFNKFRQSSCGVQFFYSPNIPYGYHAQVIHGFVEELVVSDDPEYKWIDKIRTPRASNEARQTLFFKLSGEVQRKIGLKALDLGGNAVIGYLQNFDLEGESGIVARGIGTAVTLVKLHDVLGFPCDSVNIEEITFALCSRTKTHTECTDTDDGEPLIPDPLPARTPALYPPRASTQPVDRGLPFYCASSASLTCLERSTVTFGARGRAGTRRKRAGGISFFRSATSSTLSLRTLGRAGARDFAPPEHLLDRTVRSLCTVLTPDDTRKSSSRYRLSKQIKHLRDKFDSVGEENRLTVESDDRDSDVDSSVSWRAGGSPKRSRTTGKIMAALLIGSIKNMPLEMADRESDAVSVSPGNEYIEMQDLTKRTPTGEDSRENTDVTDSDKDKERQRDAPSSPDETERSSSYENGNSTGDDLSDDTTSYKILDDSRCSLNNYSDRVEDPSSLQEKMPITPSSVESCTPDSAQQMHLDAGTSRLPSTNLTSANDYVELRKDAIPTITVDAHESNNSDVSDAADAFGPSDKENQRESLARTPATDSSSVSKPTRSSLADKRDVDDAKRSLGSSGECRTSSLDARKSKRRDDVATENSSREVHRVHLTRHERDLCRARSQSAQRATIEPVEENHASPGKKRTTDSTVEASLDSPCTTTDTSARRTSERRRCMRDLIKLIDTKLMVSSRATRRAKRTTSSQRRNRERKTCKLPTPGELSERFLSRGGASMRGHPSHRRRGMEVVPLRVPRVRSHPDSISSSIGQVYSTFSFHATSRSCGSSLVNLTDRRRTRVSASTKRATVSPAITLAIDRPSDGGSPRNSRGSARSNCGGKSDAVTAVSISESPIDTNHPTCPCPDVTSGAVSSVCNLEEASSHIDCTKLSTNTANMTYNSCVSRPSPDLRQQDEASISPSYPLPAVSSMTVKMSQSPATRTLANVPLHRRSSDSDLSVTPKGNSLGSSDRSMAGLLRTSAAVVRSMNQDTLEMLEYPFITMQHYPPGFILHIGGLVSSRSVKLLERISNLEEPEGRDAWWTEIRMEVRSHARALACNVVIGYKEETSICDDVCVLSASGTAAVINLHSSGQDSDGVVLNKLQHLQLQQGTAATVDSDREKSQQKPAAIRSEKMDGDVSVAPHSERQNGRTCRHSSESNDHEGGQSQLRCNLCHLPYSESSVPFRVNVSKCAVCKRAKVPDVVFTTIEVPANVPTTGRGCFIQATVCKNKKDLRGELNAKEISDCLPFLEYELHSLLLNKLKIKGMNAIFGLRLQVSVGERFIIGMAVGTAVYLTALPPPTIPQIASGNSWHNEEQLAEMQKSIVETVRKNREFYHLKPVGGSEMENGRVANTSDTDESDEDLPELDLGLGTRDACVLEVDDIEDMDRISSLMDDRPPDDFHVVNTRTIPGLEDLEIVRNLQMFTQVWRAKIPTTGQSASMPSKYLARLLQSLYFKLRRMVPCALCDMQFKVALAEQDEIQLTVVGMALGLGEPPNVDKYKRKVVYRSQSKDQVRKSDDSDMIFSLDEDHLENNAVSDNATRACIGNPATLSSVPVQKPRARSPLRSKLSTTHRRKHVPLKGRYGVDITPLSYLPGGRIERYQGNLNFFFIRESTSIRENGGLSGFTHSFVMEVLAIVRAHITALGGNAMVAFFMTQCVLLHSPHKNQGQCLINVGGDVVTVSYYADEKHGAASNC